MAARLLVSRCARSAAILGRQTVSVRAMSVTTVKAPPLTSEERFAMERRFEHDYHGDEGFLCPRSRCQRCPSADDAMRASSASTLHSGADMAGNWVLLLGHVLNLMNLQMKALKWTCDVCPKLATDADELKWKKICLFGVIPFLASLFVYIVIIEHEPHVRPIFKPYEHLRIYRKPLPWRDGKGPMLFNKKMVATNEGYITDPPSH